MLKCAWCNLMRLEGPKKLALALTGWKMYKHFSPSSTCSSSLVVPANTFSKSTKMLSLIVPLLVAVAQGAPAPQQDPSITSSASLPASTTYPPGVQPRSCSNHLLQFCPRSPDYPYFASGFVGAADYNNPYSLYRGFTYSPEQTSASYSCQSAFFTAYDDYYMTAAITYGEPSPASTLVSGYTSTGTFTNFGGSRVSTGFTVSTATLTNPVLSGPGDTTEIKTHVNSDGIQVLTTVTEEFHTVELTDVLYSTTTVALAEQTNPSASGIIIAAYTPATYLTNFAYTASRGSGCCRDCSLFGNDVQVYYWPTTAPAPADQTLVNDDGYTL